MAIVFSDMLSGLCAGRDLAQEEMAAAMQAMLGGEWTPAQMAAFLTALKIKGEKPAELAAAATMMRAFAAAVPLPPEVAAAAVDTCGTGGDGARTFNISTASAFVAAACGAPIAKHGNRALSGASGSSDVLALLGMPLTLTPAQVAGLIERVGFGFMFAPNHHAAMKNVMPVRRELAVRTLFNLLGPLTNPAAVQRQIIGIFDEALLLPYAETLAQLGVVHAFVVHGGGLDEVALHGETAIAEIKDGVISRRTIAPEDVGLQRAALEVIQVESAEGSRDVIVAVLAGDKGPARDVVLLNAAAALIVADKAEDFSAAVALASEAIDSGAARAKLDEFIAAAKDC